MIPSSASTIAENPSKSTLMKWSTRTPVSSSAADTEQAGPALMAELIIPCMDADAPWPVSSQAGMSMIVSRGICTASMRSPSAATWARIIASLRAPSALPNPFAEAAPEFASESEPESSEASFADSRSRVSDPMMRTFVSSVSFSGTTPPWARSGDEVIFAPRLCTATAIVTGAAMMSTAATATKVRRRRYFAARRRCRRGPGGGDVSSLSTVRVLLRPGHGGLHTKRNVYNPKHVQGRVHITVCHLSTEIIGPKSPAERSLC